MILQLSEIQHIIESNPNKLVVAKAQSMRNTLFMHIYGEGMGAYLQKINSFENADQYAVRKKYARSNRDIMDRILRPIDKVFSATGGSTYYNLSENLNKEFRARLQNVENGLSLRKWMEQYWRAAYIADPMSITFIEIDGNGEAYPTYKGANEIFSYKLNGRKLDYVFFKHKPEHSAPPSGVAVDGNSRFYRVVDDAYDYLVKYDNGKASIVEDETYPNYFGAVPAILNSDIPVLGGDCYCSFIQPIIELADEFLREGSVKSVYKLLHGFPKYWEYQSQCPECKGTKHVRGEECPVCKGTGIKLRMDVSEARLLPMPYDKDSPVIAPSVGGYIVPPIDAWTQMTDELKLLETYMFQTIWGTKQTEDMGNETATGKFIDTQPVNEALAKISDAAETVEQYITDTIGALYYGASYRGSSVNYGRRFIIEGPDVLWQKYSAARSSGAPDTMLDSLLRDYIDSKYDNNSLERQKSLKLIDVEPFPHLTVSQVKALDVSSDDFAQKLYFGEFVSTLAENEVLVLSVKDLKTRLKTFITTKNIKNEKPGSN